ncbi:DUF3341 domain-containing protein [Membranicola marinus]|uniref:DUF3341 domain-containing protein n=1 Tax=Membranihabitans marinus TaxID=1227546 RepID=A0A953HVI1_9BACT|nr:DUF3341 domain-containing protein [Membranihabitans marinus]MBY5959020.1 DUF3341 domain-containing protein [Membranihabitans marinus]
MENKKILFGLYDDEQILLDAVKEAKDGQLDIYDVYTPFPVHGLDPLLELSESRLHIVGFFFGVVGALTAFLGMTWIFTDEWPMIIGGKPYWSVPAFIPITFELTVLFAAFGMVFVFYAVNGLSPRAHTEVLHPRLTDDRFAIAFDTSVSSNEEISRLEKFFERSGAEVHIKNLK